MGNIKTFNIKVTMNERWIPHFCSMLLQMERFGKLGHSGLVGFYSDGDGDFRPEFEFDTEFERVDGCTENIPEDLDIIFDAG